MDVAHLGEQTLDHPVEGRAVALHRRLESQAFALGQDGQTVVAHGAGDDHRVAGSGLGAAGIILDQHPAHARGVDEYLVRRALGHDFGVAGDDGHVGVPCGLGHGGHDLFQHLEFQALFDDVPAGQVQGLGPEHGHVVHRTVHGQRTDVAARKENRVHGEGVGAHGQGAVHFQEGRIVHAIEHGVVEMTHEQLADEPLRGFAPAAVVQENPFVVHQSHLRYQSPIIEFSHNRRRRPRESPRRPHGRRALDESAAAPTGADAGRIAGPWSR